MCGLRSALSRAAKVEASSIMRLFPFLSNPFLLRVLPRFSLPRQLKRKIVSFHSCYQPLEQSKRPFNVSLVTKLLIPQSQLQLHQLLSRSSISLSKVLHPLMQNLSAARWPTSLSGGTKHVPNESQDSRHIQARTGKSFHNISIPRLKALSW